MAATHVSSVELTLIGASVALFLSALTSKASSKLGVPTLVLFMFLGMLFGSEGPGGIYFDDAKFAHSLGTIALVLILFAGGLETNWTTIKPVVRPGVLLATVGVVITAGLTGAVAAYLFKFQPLHGFLLGAIVSSTDAAAVFGVLRARKLRLKGRLTALLEFESGSNDPMAVFLTITLTALILHPEQTYLPLVFDLFREILLGGVVGYSIGRVGVWVINRANLDYEGLYPALSLGIAFLSYGGTQFVGGSGFLAVYITAIVMGSRNFLHKIGLIQFHDGIAWLMQIAMFICLGLLVYPSQLVPLAGSSILLALFLIFIARPVAVIAALAFAPDFTWSKKLFLSWVGLRGAVPIILATIPLTAGVPNALVIFNVVTFVVLASVLLQGTTIAIVADWLKILVHGKDSIVERRVSTQMFEATVGEESSLAGKRIVELNIPGTALVVLLTRGEESYIPRGGTMLQPGDKLLISSRRGDLEDLRHLFQAQ